MQTDFKNFKTMTFDTVKIKGMYEKELVPIELIVNVGFSVVPTKRAVKETDTESFQQTLKSKLSLFSIDRLFKGQKFEGWKYDGSRYTYGHDYSQVKLKKQVSSLGIDFYFVHTSEDTCDVEKFYGEVVKFIAELDCFKPTELFEVRPGRKNESA